MTLNQQITSIIKYHCQANRRKDKQIGLCHMKRLLQSRKKTMSRIIKYPHSERKYLSIHYKSDKRLSNIYKVFVKLNKKKKCHQTWGKEISRTSSKKTHSWVIIYEKKKKPNITDNHRMQCNSQVQ